MCMKFLIALLLNISLFAFSCKKAEKEYCWKCETYVYDTLLGPRSLGTFQATTRYYGPKVVCGMSESAIRKYEADYSRSSLFHRETTTCSK